MVSQATCPNAEPSISSESRGVGQGLIPTAAVQSGGRPGAGGAMLPSRQQSLQDLDRFVRHPRSLASNVSVRPTGLLGLLSVLLLVLLTSC